MNQTPGTFINALCSSPRMALNLLGTACGHRFSQAKKLPLSDPRRAQILEKPWIGLIIDSDDPDTLAREIALMKASNRIADLMFKRKQLRNKTHQKRRSQYDR